MFLLGSAKAHNIANILTKDIFTLWGIPTYLVSDHGPQFTSHHLNTICQQWGVIQKLTTAYYHQTNIIERTNRTLKFMISAFIKEDYKHWDQWIPEFLFAINTAWQESIGFTPQNSSGPKKKKTLERMLAKKTFLRSSSLQWCGETRRVDKNSTGERALLPRKAEKILQPQTQRSLLPYERPCVGPSVRTITG